MDTMDRWSDSENRETLRKSDQFLSDSSLISSFYTESECNASMDNFSSSLIFLCVPATMDGVKSKTCKITPIAKMLPLCNFATVLVQGWTGQIAWCGSKRKLVPCLKSQVSCWTRLHCTGWELGWPGNNIQYTIYTLHAADNWITVAGGGASLSRLSGQCLGGNMPSSACGVYTMTQCLEPGGEG